MARTKPARKPVTEADKEAAKAKRAAKMAQIDESIQRGLEALTDADAWRDFLAHGSQTTLGRYSFRNQLLIHMQDPTATDVAGFGDWIKRGRCVRRGETSRIVIMGPLKFKRAVVNGQVQKRPPAPGEESRIVMCGVTPESVFTITQTERLEGKDERPAPNAEPVDLDEYRALIVAVAGDLAESILAALDEALQDQEDEAGELDEDEAGEDAA
jgi:cellobiose-specific phosphotransferase system component IIA